MKLFSRTTDGLIALIILCFILPSLIMKDDPNKKHERINWASVLSYIIIFAVGIGGMVYIKTIHQ